MTTAFTASRVHETLDERGVLDATQGPGTYALKVRTPNDVESVMRAFREHVDTLPERETLERLTEDRVLYVGASGNVYDRLQEHANANVRKALFLRVMTPVRVFDVWPTTNAFETEYRKALELSRQGWTCWSDGEVV
jgi:hypothetical protein